VEIIKGKKVSIHRPSQGRTNSSKKRVQLAEESREPYVVEIRVRYSSSES